MINKPSRLRPLILFALLCFAVCAMPACGAQESTPEKAGGPPPSVAGAQGDDTVVAKIGDEPITDAELKEQAKADLKRIESQIYETKRRVLNALIEQKLLEGAASKAGKSPDEFVAEEVDAKIETVSDEDARKFYDENKQRLRGEFDDIKPQIFRFLRQKQRNELMAALTKRLKEETKVMVYLEAPKIQVDIGDAPVKGNPDAPITIVEFSDYECPYCKRSQGTIKEVVEKYEGKIKMVFKDFPLSFHKRAMPAAQAARCAGEQGKYWEYHDKLFSGSGLSDDDFKKYAEELSLDADALAACVSSNKYQAAVSADMTQGSSVGVSGTPAFFINGRFLSGAQPIDKFSEIIDEELAKAGAS